MKTKIDIGIYIGNEYSAIARMENGEPLVVKSSVLNDTMPTCVYVNKKRAIQVGGTAYNAMKRDELKASSNFEILTSNSFKGFLRTIGTDKKYYSSNLEKEFSSEELIAEIIKALKYFISDDEVNSAVIAIPAKFTINQKDAIRRAGRLAGLKQVELLQEPIAASMTYGLDAKSKDGYWLVFDFGGETFDATLLKVEDGIMKVIDTEGDNYLGGKNLDYAIVNEIIIPYIQEYFTIDSILADDRKNRNLQNSLRFYAEEARKQIYLNDTHNIFSDIGDFPDEDDKGDHLELDINITQEIIQNTLGPLFQKSIDICKHLLERNSLNGNSLSNLILIGEPTYSSILRKMLEQQIIKPNTSIDPITAIAKGTALFASTVDVSDDIKEQQKDKTKIQLEFGYEATTVEEEEFVTVKILQDKTECAIPKKVFVDIVRADKAWSSGKIEIDDKGDIFEVKLNIKKENTFNVFAYNEQGDLLSSEPSSFTIIQGSKIGSATLPYFFGIEVKSKASGKIVFRSIKGLEKNQSTPAIGTINGWKAERDIRPGVKEDLIKLPIYQGEYGADGTRAIHNEHVYDIIITGEDLPKLLPSGSDVDITIKVDKSERISIFAFFPSLDYTHEIEVPSNTTQKEIDANWLESEINKAQQTLNLIKQEGVYQYQEKLNKLDTEISETKKCFEQGKGDYDRKKDVLDSLRRSLKNLDEIQASNEWPKTEEELKDVFYSLEETNQKFGNDKTNGIVEQFKEQIPEIIKEKNVKVAQEMIDNMRQLDFALIVKNIELNKDSILLEIDGLKTKLIDSLETNANLTKDVFTSMFDVLFDLGKEIENNSILNEHLSKFDEIKLKVKEIVE